MVLLHLDHRLAGDRLDDTPPLVVDLVVPAQVACIVVGNHGRVAAIGSEPPIGDQCARSSWTGPVSGSWHRGVQALCGAGGGGKKYSPHRRDLVATGAPACTEKKEIFPWCDTRQARGLTNTKACDMRD